MKKIGMIVLLLLLAGMLYAQQSEPATVASAAAPDTNSGNQTTPGETTKNMPNVRFATPTYADLYCAGFINKQLVPNANYVAGGVETPSTTKFSNGDVVYLAGSGYQTGAQYTIVRELHDVNEYEVYPGQHKLLAAAGQPYAEMGRVKILDTRNKNAVAQIEFSCDSILPGDVAVPFAEKPSVTFRPPAKFDRFAPPSGRLTGRILLAKDFDTILGTGAKVYMNVGSNQGVKVGNYFRAARPYTDDLKNPVDSLSFKASIGEDTQKKRPSYGRQMLTRSNGPTIEVADMPRRGLGEVVIISVTPTSSTGMITFALEDIHIGDDVELEGEQQ